MDIVRHSKHSKMDQEDEGIGMSPPRIDSSQQVVVHA